MSVAFKARGGGKTSRLAAPTIRGFGTCCGRISCTCLAGGAGGKSRGGGCRVEKGRCSPTYGDGSCRLPLLPGLRLAVGTWPSGWHGARNRAGHACQPDRGRDDGVLLRHAYRRELPPRPATERYGELSRFDAFVRSQEKDTRVRKQGGSRTTQIQSKGAIGFASPMRSRKTTLLEGQTS